MSRKAFNPTECIAPLNNIKMGIQFRDQPMTASSLQKALQSCGLPINSLFRKVLQEFNVIKRISRGKYIFPSKDPIYIGLLEQIQKEYLKLMKEVKREKPREKSSEKEIWKESLTIESAISLLKKCGYLVFKQI